jgi:hypothetical protein
MGAIISYMYFIVDLRAKKKEEKEFTACNVFTISKFVLTVQSHKEPSL